MKRVLSILGAVLLTALMFGQATETLTHREVIRNSNNDIVTSSPIGMRVSILQDSVTGTPVYIETHSSTTDENGLVSIELGGGTSVTGTFADVQLETSTYFVKTETDPTGGVNYSAIVSTSLLYNEPYASIGNHFLGEYYGDGIVFYVDENGQHGLITATIDKSKRIKRHNGKFSVTHDARDEIEIREYNTERINAIKGAGSSNAQIFDNPQDDNLSDWYLPTRYDLNLLYVRRAVIGGYSDFAKGWRSTEMSSVNAWFYSFITGATFTNGKDDAEYIRILRKF